MDISIIIIKSRVGYIDDLFTKLWESIEDGVQSKMKDAVVPPPLCSSLEKPDKETAIAEHKTRFSSQIHSHNQKSNDGK